MDANNTFDVSDHPQPEHKINLLIFGVEPFLRSCQFCSYSRASQHFTEPERSLPCSQEPSDGPYSEPDQSNSYHPILSLKDLF
jgi:hypothetical protein